MSIDQLQQDLDDVIAACPSGPLTSAADMAAYNKNNLLPALKAIVSELADIDEVVEGLVHSAEDILHGEAAAVFVGLIQLGTRLATELAARLGPTDNDQRALLRDYAVAAKEAGELLDEITIFESEPDPDADAEDTEDAPKEPS